MTHSCMGQYNATTQSPQGSALFPGLPQASRPEPPKGSPGPAPAPHSTLCAHPSLLTGTRVVHGAGGPGSPGCAPGAHGSPGSGPAPRPAAAGSPLPERFAVLSTAIRAGGRTGGSLVGLQVATFHPQPPPSPPRLPPTPHHTSHCVVSRQALKSSCWLDSRSRWLCTSNWARSSSSRASRPRSSPRSPCSSPRSRDTSSSSF